MVRRYISVVSMRSFTGTPPGRRQSTGAGGPFRLLTSAVSAAGSAPVSG
jgi:hypothetical protein